MKCMLRYVFFFTGRCAACYVPNSTRFGKNLSEMLCNRIVVLIKQLYPTWDLKYQSLFSGGRLMAAVDMKAARSMLMSALTVLEKSRLLGRSGIYWCFN